MALWVTAVSLVILLIAYAAFPGFWPPMSPQMSADWHMVGLLWLVIFVCST